MFKKFWHTIKSPFWKTTKFSSISSLAIATVSVFVQIIAWVGGSVGFGAGIENILQTYLLAFSMQMFLYSPWIFLYAGVKLFFQALFPKEQEVNMPPEETKTKPETKKMGIVHERKTAIQQTILTMLEENNGLLDMEEIHMLERINEEILTKTEQYYESLDPNAQKTYEQDVLKRFEELEQKVVEINQKAHRQKERNMDKQLHIIDQMTK